MRVHSVTVVLITLACSPRDSAKSGAAPPAATPPPATPSIDSTPSRSPEPPGILRALYERLTAIGSDRVTVRSRLGEPQRASSTLQQNTEDSTVTDTLIQWTYNRLRFKWLVFRGRDWVVEVRAATDDPAVAPLVEGVNTLEAVEATLGTPLGTTTVVDTMVYSYDRINLYFVAARLAVVEAVPFVD